LEIAVFGLGYVGTVSAACFARDGHRVIGVDVNPTKVALIEDGLAPVVESGLSELVRETRNRELLRATLDVEAAVRASQLSIVCVGTPSQANGDLDYRYLRDVCEQIGRALRQRSAPHTVIVRSTVLPGTMRELVIPALEAAAGGKAGRAFGICHNPEFLREGSALFDFDHPPKTVIGVDDESTGTQVARLYASLDAPLFRVPMPVAELVKYVDNCWHAVKVGFANEIGRVAKASGIDSHAVMSIFCQDTKLNISTSYLRPGQAFGGSCLPKDLRALTYRARSLDLEVPLLDSILASNEVHKRQALARVMACKSKRVGILGFSFKAGTDDLRESPVVDLIESLLGKGYELRIYDRNVNLSKLVGANREFLLDHIPHISRLMAESIDEVIDGSDVLVIGNADPEFRECLAGLREDQVVIDLVRISPDPKTPAEYDGLCW
jgi:GDP-mannose 6-dehydrogenase